MSTSRHSKIFFRSSPSPTIENTRRLYLEYIAQALVNRRLENRARSGGSYLVATVEQQYVSRSADVTMAQIVPLSDWQSALADVRGVIADAVTTPPSQADIDREANEIEAFLQARRYNDSQLLLVGGSASDDPEGHQVLAECRERAAGNRDIHVLELPPDAHLEINALQRASTVIVQKSLREGFGLTVTEALWKAKPVIATATGSTCSGLAAETITWLM